MNKKDTERLENMAGSTYEDLKMSDKEEKNKVDRYLDDGKYNDKDNEDM